MSGMPWLRLYAEIIHDPKTGLLTDAEFRSYVELLCIACESGENGNTRVTSQEADWKLRRNVTETLQVLERNNLVHFNETNQIVITNWDKRQKKSDNSAERVRKHRVKKKETDEKQSDTDCNSDVTLQKRNDNAIDKSRVDKSRVDKSRVDKSRVDKSKAKRSTALPDDFTVTPEMMQWASEQGIQINLVSETDRFKDWCISNGKLYKDWIAAWRNWMRKSQEFAGRSFGNRVVQLNPSGDPSYNGPLNKPFPSAG